jgi:hypothetical protein
MTATLSEVFGNSTASFGLEGNLASQFNAGINPAATGGDYVLAVYTLPANAFDQAGRQVQITANGAFGANTNNKRVKIFVGATTAALGAAISGGTAIADTGTVTTNGSGFQVSATIGKYGAAGSNTQIGVHNGAQVGAAVSALVAPTPLTLLENSPILIAVTGNAGTTATDIALNAFEVNVCN